MELEKDDFCAACFTKDYPEKLTVNVETQVGYNQQSSFKDVISSTRSKTDWLGYDDGLRERTQKHSEYNHPTLDNAGNSTLSTYDEMVALADSDYELFGEAMDTEVREVVYAKLGFTSDFYI